MFCKHIYKQKILLGQLWTETVNELDCGGEVKEKNAEI